MLCKSWDILLLVKQTGGLKTMLNTKDYAGFVDSREERVYIVTRDVDESCEHCDKHIPAGKRLYMNESYNVTCSKTCAREY